MYSRNAPAHKRAYRSLLDFMKRISGEREISIFFFWGGQGSSLYNIIRLLCGLVTGIGERVACGYSNELRCAHVVRYSFWVNGTEHNFHRFGYFG